MTDATAGRGGVGIRLYTTGGELVRRNFDQVGDSGKKMWAEVALGQKAANPALRALSIGANEARGGVEGLASRAGPAANILHGFGAAGLAAGAGLGGLAIALNKAQASMKWAAELTDTAERIGVSVEQLQAWNFVADEAGVSTSSLQANLEKLNGVLGAFKSGIGDAKLKPVFEALGITRDQLQNVQTADDMMMILADTLGQVKDRALQVKFARSLGVEESLPILRLGSEGIRDLSDEAERLGLVVGKDVVKALDEADRKLEVAQQRIDSTVRLSVAGLAEDFATLVGQIAAAIVQLQRWDAQLRARNGAGQRPDRNLWAIASDNLRGRTAEEGEKARDEGARRQAGWLTWIGVNQPRLEAIEREDRLRAQMRDLAFGTGAYAETPGDYEGPDEKGSRKGASSNRDAEQRQQRVARVADQIARLNDEVRREMEGEFRTIEERHGFARDRMEAEAAQRDLAIQRGQEEFVRTKGLRGISDTEAAILREKEAQLLAAKQENDRQKELREQADRRLKDDETAAQAAMDMLGIDADLARTAGERARIQREILVIEQKIARDRLALQLKNDNELSDDQIAGRLRDFDRRSAGELTVFDHDEQERLRQQFKSYGREVVGAIEDGRIGEYIGDQLKAKLLDGALNALFGMMSGGSKSEGGGFLGSALRFGASLFGRGGGKAAGGDTRASFMYGAAEHGPELFMLSGNGHVSSAAETAKMVQEMAARGGGASRSTIAPPVIHMGDTIITAPGADAAELKRLREEVRTLNRTLESRAIEAVSDYRARTHGGG